MKIMKYLFKHINKYMDYLFNYIFPPIKFKKGYFKPDKEIVTDEDLDRWAEEFERKFNKARRRKRD